MFDTHCNLNHAHRPYSVSGDGWGHCQFESVSRGNFNRNKSLENSWLVKVIQLPIVRTGPFDGVKLPIVLFPHLSLKARAKVMANMENSMVNYQDFYYGGVVPAAGKKPAVVSNVNAVSWDNGCEPLQYVLKIIKRCSRIRWWTKRPR